MCGSPVTPVYDMHDSDPQALFERAVERLNLIGGLAFVHVIEGATGGPRDNIAFDYTALRAKFDGAWISNNGYDKAMAEQAISRGDTDAVSFGRAYIANPDLVRRLREDAPLAEPNQATLYGGGAEGYTDYPALPA